MKYSKQAILFIALLFLLYPSTIMAQEDTAAGKPVVKLQYFNNNNRVQYFILDSKLKKNKIFTPQKNKAYQLYIDSSSAPNLVAQLQTNESGKAKAILPPSLQAVWNASAQHTFIVKAGDEEVITDYAITKAKITIDTSSADGVKNIIVTVMKQENDKWAPAKEVEMKVGIQRLGSILSAGDEATYTTDSTGSVTVQLKKDSLPGDEKGNIILAAKVEDNDQFGNLLAEKKVLWGKAVKPDTHFFDQRTLWTTRFRTPIWLLLMAYSIVIGVWGTLIYLVVQIVKIKKMGIA